MNIEKQASQYQSLNKDRKYTFLYETYFNQNMSYAQIAELVGTYPNRIRRDAQSLGVPTRTLSDAQSVALNTGRRKHPTQGKQRTQKTKLKISEKRSAAWNNLTTEQRKKISEKGHQQWENMSDEEKRNFHDKAGKAVRKAAKEGSKLEKFIRTELIKNNYRVEFHKEYFLKNEKLQIDLFLPQHNVAIEVDGPSHFKPIWGTTTLIRNQKSDKQKAGLLLGKGMVLIRIKQTKILSQKLQRDILKQLLDTLDNIKTKFPEQQDRYIILGDQL